MEYLVCYDIVENDIRKNVADICLNKGLARIQYSVFFGELSKNRAEEVLIEIKDEIKDEEAIIFLVEVCEKCSKRKKVVVENKKETKKEEKEELKEMKQERVKQDLKEKSKKNETNQEKKIQAGGEGEERRKPKRKKKTRISEELMKTLKEKGVIVL